MLRRRFGLSDAASADGMSDAASADDLIDAVSSVRLSVEVRS